MKKLPIKRIPYFDKKLPNKEYMTSDEVKELFDGEVTISEKIDGKGIFVQTFDDVGLYTEYVKFKHSIHYTKLPKNIVSSFYRVILALEHLGVIRPVKECCPPTLFKGEIKMPSEERLKKLLDVFMSFKSEWSDEQIEGIVVANYGKQLFGKISRFDDELIETHWTRKPKVKNYGR